MFSLFSYLLTFFAILFWIFRVIVTLLYQLDIDFFATPLNVNMEIALLFASLPCLILVVKRNIVGAAAYLAIYGAYFGTALYEVILSANEVGINVENASDMIFLVIGIVVPLLTFLDILINRNRNLGKGNKKEEWFYGNEEYDRKFDERSDRNQYRL